MLYDPNMFLPNMPEGWFVLWCPWCGYSVTWDKQTVDETEDMHELYSTIQHQAAPHECPGREKS